MTQTERRRNPMDRLARYWHVLEAAPLTSLVGIYATLLAILHVGVYRTGYPGASSPFGLWVIVSLLLAFMALVLSLGMVIRMTGKALLTSLLVIYAIFFVICHVIACLAGFQREPFPSWIITLMMSGLQILVLSLGLVIRIMTTWPKHIPGWSRRMMLRLLAIVGTVAFLVLPFTRFGWPPYKTSTRAFRRYVHANVDLNAVRAWLDALDGNHDPNYTYDLASGATIEDWWPEAAPWAKTITPLNPHSARLAPDSNNHAAIRIEWLRGFNRSGFVIGSKTMETPPANFSRPDEYRLPLDSGAYTWHERGGLWRLLRAVITRR